MSQKEKVILAYSGGLDTSIIIPWLKEKLLPKTTSLRDMILAVLAQVGSIRINYSSGIV